MTQMLEESKERIERGRVKEFKSDAAWFFFDCVFKPLAVASIIFLERFFRRRVRYESKTGHAIRSVAWDVCIEQWGHPNYPMMKLCGLAADFIETDTAYKCFFVSFVKNLAKRL